MTTKGALVVIGSGPGIGRTTAAHFAGKGFKHIILLSRDASRLAEDAKMVSSTTPDTTVETAQIDMADDEAAVKSALGAIDAKLKAAGVPLEVVLYNAARVAPSKIMEWEAKSLEEDLKVCALRSPFPLTGELGNSLLIDHHGESLCNPPMGHPSAPRNSKITISQPSFPNNIRHTLSRPVSVPLFVGRRQSSTVQPDAQLSQEV